jgi:abhydrolase domain-containing protein 12
MLVIEWQTENSVIKEEILKYSLHDVIISYLVITIAVMHIFEVADPLFK